MKSFSIRSIVFTLRGGLLRTAALTVILGALVCMACGCCVCEQPGETAAEGSRRHKRIARIDQQELMSDNDTFFLIDKPSKLSDKRIP